MPYDVGVDPYKDDGATVLRNKLGITKQSYLDAAEAEITYAAISTLLLGQIPPFQEFNWQLLCKIHNKIFGEIYDWAGQPRTVELSKGKTSFARKEHIAANAEEIFKKLAAEGYLGGRGFDDFIERLAYYYSDFNVLHPFREGNGRAIRTLLSMLAENVGWLIIWDNMRPKQNVTACIAAYNGDEKPLREMLGKIVEPIEPF